MYTAIAMNAVCMGGNLTQARRGGVFNTTGPLRYLSEYASRLDSNLYAGKFIFGVSAQCNYDHVI